MTLIRHNVRLMTNVEDFLKANGIDYVQHEHVAVFTAEDLGKHCSHVPGLHCKNLFLRNQKYKRYFLVVLPATHTTDLKKVSEVVGEKKLSFANPETLREKLGVEVGSVSPFGLLNDTLHEVEVYIDQVVYDADIVSFHPNRNTASLELSGAMFRKFLELMKQKIEVVNL